MTPSPQKFSLSIDLGTSNTLVYLKGQGIVVEQASLLALKNDEGRWDSFELFGAGTSAERLQGKTPPQIRIEAPLAAGVIQDTELAKLLLSKLTNPVLPWSRHLPLASTFQGILISAPNGVTVYERMAFYEAARSLGFSKVGLIDEPLAAALGSNLPVLNHKGQMLADLGSGITEVIVTSSGVIVESGSLRKGSNDLDEAIVAFVRNRFDLEISRAQAEHLKIFRSTLNHPSTPVLTEVNGKCTQSKLPRKKLVDARELSDCLNAYVTDVQNLILRVFEKSPPELVSDVLESGLWLSGGGALLNGLPEELSRRLGFPVRLVADPLRAVIIGSGRIVSDPDLSVLCRSDA